MVAVAPRRQTARDRNHRRVLFGAKWNRAVFSGIYPTQSPRIIRLVECATGQPWLGIGRCGPDLLGRKPTGLGAETFRRNR